MKINRFLAIALVVLIVIATMGAVTYKGFAQGNQPPAASDCVDDEDTAEANEIEDVEAENGCEDDEDGEDDGEDGEEASGVDEADEAVPASTGISADEAQAVAEEANPGVNTLAVEFDRENGQEIWEVELDNGLDVKVDANTGKILYTETRD